jgi:hypothetical protein
MKGRKGKETEKRRKGEEKERREVLMVRSKVVPTRLG